MYQTLYLNTVPRLLHLCHCTDAVRQAESADPSLVVGCHFHWLCQLSTPCPLDQLLASDVLAVTRVSRPRPRLGHVDAMFVAFGQDLVDARLIAITLSTSTSSCGTLVQTDL